MFNEVWDIIKERYFSFGQSQSSSKLERVKVRNAIIRLCDDMLKYPDDSLVFEVMSNSLPFAVSAIDDEVVTSKYSILQISETLFEARLAVVDML